MRARAASARRGRRRGGAAATGGALLLAVGPVPADASAALVSAHDKDVVYRLPLK